MQMPDPDTSEYAALIEFVATSGRLRSHPAVEEKADQLITRMFADRAQAMTQSIKAMVSAAAGGFR